MVSEVMEKNTGTSQWQVLDLQFNLHVLCSTSAWASHVSVAAACLGYAENFKNTALCCDGQR